MQVLSSGFVKDKKVLLRLDLDVPLRQAQGKLVVEEDFRLKTALPTLNLCLENASEVIIIGHIGRPDGVDPQLSVSPIYNWLMNQGYGEALETDKLKLLENLRFEVGEDSGDLEYAKELASLGEVYINEAFGAHHPASSTTVLPTLLPHYAGLRFAKEVAKLTQVRENPKRPLVVIIGGIKSEDKLPAIKAMAKIADTVLVGGKIISEISPYDLMGEDHVMVGKLIPEGTDINDDTISLWQPVIQNASMVVWNGPLGKIEELGTYKIAKIIIESKAESIVGGGDTISILDKSDLLDKFSFVSVGGGAMLKFLSAGTLPTIEALT